MSIFRLVFWMVLAIPAGLMVNALVSREALAMDLYQPSGEMALRLMLLAMLAGPLSTIFGSNRFLRTWLAVRRNLGVAAFCYGLLHFVFYLIDMQSMAAILDELWLPGIWTGWLAFLLMALAASISTDWAMQKLGRNWKRLQRGVYGAYLLACIHWWLLDRDPGPALVYLAPLLIAWTVRLSVTARRRNTRKEIPA